MFIKSIKQANVKGYLKLEIDTGEGKEWLLLSDGQYDALGRPTPCEEISEEDFRIAQNGDEYNKAKKKALNILSFGDNSERELLTKLSRAGFSREVRERVLSEMKSLSYIDEERQLKRLIESEALSKLQGPKKIVARLSAKGYAPDKVKAIMRRLEIEKIIDFTEIKEKLLAGVDDSEERRKILFKKGF
jgi:SOS response regulatory protein OraA/RecX